MSMVNLISPYWETNRLFIRDSEIEKDLDDLQTLWESTAYIGEYDGHIQRNKDDMDHYLRDGDLPPGGNKEYFKVQPVFIKETSEMIGYITMYHGYPDSDSLWITFFYVNKKKQGQGYGREVINELTIEAEKADFQRILLIVALKNWEAIRFWTKAGFDKITGVHGDRTYGEGSYANLTLEKSLKEKL